MIQCGSPGNKEKYVHSIVIPYCINKNNSQIKSVEEEKQNVVSMYLL